MPSIRRGFAAGASGDEGCAARAKDGSIDSRNGSESAMPVPRRNCRRESGRRVETYGAAGQGDDNRSMAGTGSRFGDKEMKT